MNFSQEKSIQLSKHDNSDKGNIDLQILPLVKKINQNKDYYTTSSCAGRIVLIKDNEKKKEGIFLFRTHEKISFYRLNNELVKSTKRYNGLIYFKQEPCILHVACSSWQKAQELINKAKFAGWKNSGIIASKKRIICEMRSTERIDLPIANKRRVLLSEDYLKLLVKEANKKLLRTGEKIKKFEKLLP